jgi:hypothetical protein
MGDLLVDFKIGEGIKPVMRGMCSHLLLFSGSCLKLSSQQIYLAQEWRLREVHKLHISIHLDADRLIIDSTTYHSMHLLKTRWVFCPLLCGPKLTNNFCQTQLHAMDSTFNGCWRYWNAPTRYVSLLHMYQAYCPYVVPSLLRRASSPSHRMCDDGLHHASIHRLFHWTGSPLI